MERIVATIDPDPDDDFSDLDAEIAEAMAQKESVKALAAKRKRLAVLAGRDGGAAELERQELLASVRRLEESHVWDTKAAVAYFYVQTCEACGARHRFFMGWMAAQDHRTDETAHRLIKGKPAEGYPEKIVEYDMGKVEMCSNCVECVLAINAAAQGRFHEQENP